jgi:hypothetical protein
MSATAVAAADIDESIFSAESYNLPIPSLDGFRAVELELRFSGAGKLDRTSVDDLELLEAARLGNEVLLLVRGEISGKGFKLNRSRDEQGELSHNATVRVLSVEAAEMA